jgi:hypothetical protein
LHHRTDARRLQLAYPRRKPCDPDACPSLRNLSTRSDPVYVCRASSLGFVAQPRNPDSFVVNHRKPRRLGVASTPIPLMTWPPHHPGSTLGLRLNKEMLPNFVLLFYPPCGLQMISFAHRVHQVEPTCLSTPQRPHRLRPFTPALHLHQCKSSRNLHLQYLTKCQSTPLCQSLVTPRSNHPPVIKCFGPHQGLPTPIDKWVNPIS